MLMYGRSQHNIVKQLSSNKKKKRIHFTVQGTQVWETKIPHAEGLLILHTAAEDPASHNEYPACRNQDLMEPKQILKKKKKTKKLPW